MADYRRMEWQHRANRIASVALVVLIIANLDEVVWAFRYHFPWWDDVLMAVTMPLNYLSWFVKKHTDIYRIDL